MTSRPAAPESETPEAVHAQLARKGPNLRGRIRDVIKALRGENEKTVDRAVGHLIGCCKGEMIFRRVALKEIERLERTLSLAQTEIKGHARVEDELKTIIAEFERVACCPDEQFERLEKDAARYRWLRECSVTRSDRTIYVMHNLYANGLFLRSDYPSHDRLDAAIDAALKARA